MSNKSTSQPKVISDAAAATRENEMQTNGAEPISLRLLLGCAIIFVIAGGVLFGGGNLFNYKNTVKKDYVRAYAPGEEAGGPKPKPALEAYINVGSKVYVTCSACHGMDGKGTAAAPSLAGSEWVNEASLRPAMIVINGCEGPITVAGKTFEGKMEPLGETLNAQKLAGVLNYVRNSFGNKSEKVISVEMAQNAFDLSKERNGSYMTAEELNASYNKELKGTPLERDAMVNPKTLKLKK